MENWKKTHSTTIGDCQQGTALCHTAEADGIDAADPTRRSNSAGEVLLGSNRFFFSSQLRFLDIVIAGGHVMHTLERECPPVIVVF